MKSRQKTITSGDLERVMVTLDRPGPELLEEYGIDGNKVIAVRENLDGNQVFLCYDERQGKQFYYTITVSSKNSDWNKVAKKYRRA